MKEKILFVYDNRKNLNKSIKNIVGIDSYGDIVYKRKNLRNRIKSVIDDFSSMMDYFYLNTKFDLEKLKNISTGYTHFIHFYSDCVITDINQFKILVEKTRYVNEIMRIGDQSIYGFVFGDLPSYIDFLINNSEVEDYGSFLDVIQPSLCIESISNYDNFLTFFSSGFEARHFNSVSGDKYIVTKRSNQKKKIKSEHDFYYLIPESMKHWFVTPFDYNETEEYASYKMERINTPDIALQWVHEAISVEDFECLLDKLFFFINSRASKPVDSATYRKIMDDLYIKKVKDRIASLKEMKEYEEISYYLARAGKYHSIDEIVDQYYKLYHSITDNYKFENKLVIGHGDLCFSNILYYKEIGLLKFIDVKGALTEKDLWTNPYYDIAKLSHSICGSYDFFNNEMYEIYIDDSCSIALQVNQPNLEKYKEVFKNVLKKNKFDYRLVRLYEASLFLSMLPLHIDNPRKVIGFILNAISILEEVSR